MGISRETLWLSPFLLRLALLFLLLPMNALDRALVYSLLNPVLRGPVGVNHLGMPQRFIEAEYFRTDLLTIATGNAFFRHNYGYAPPHFNTSMFKGH
jgi:hypothetical protein